ncbi:MAG: SOS response-associated peptidase [Candidatus Saccharimonadales bacterium]
MCGRYTYLTSEELIHEFDLLPAQANQLNLLAVPDNYNAAPGMQMPVIIRGVQEHVPELMTWGLIPAWTRGKSQLKLINARKEGLFEKSMWKRLVNTRRCIVPASGFYEWKKTPEGKIPYYITPKDSKIFSFAGLWDEWTNDKGVMMKTYTIITAAPNQEMAAIHDRMPVILSKNQAGIWMSPINLTEAQAEDVLQPAPDGTLRLQRVSTAVNSTRNNYKELIYPLED